MFFKKEYQYLCRNDDGIILMPGAGNQSNKNECWASGYSTFQTSLSGWLLGSWF